MAIESLSQLLGDFGVQEASHVFVGQVHERRDVEGCFTASAVNSSIGLGVIDSLRGAHAYESIVRSLLNHEDLWDGSKLKVVDLGDVRLVRIIEDHLPVRLGEADDDGWRLVVQKDFDQIREDLAEGKAHIIANKDKKHAYASVKAFKDDGAIFCVDPEFPSHCLRVDRKRYSRFFDADENGLLNVITITPR